MISATKYKLLCISGSTRKHSSNEAVLKQLASMYAGEFHSTIYARIDELPHFNPDLDHEAPPASVVAFREMVAAADAVVICTPEYVFSLPGALKNAIEWMVSTVIFTDKPFAYIIASASGEKAFESLDLVMTTLQVKMGAGSKVLIKAPKGKVNDDGTIKDAATIEQLRALMTSLKKSMGI
ncbi:MAG: NAD(P)H-dependent oxidoreductase [Bacteroidia bacterium]|nr:NAD(P)H-dependent oxidoreductase [Bacteroidia bacterium]